MPFHKSWREELFNRSAEEDGDDIEFEEEGFAPPVQPFTTVTRDPITGKYPYSGEDERPVFKGQTKAEGEAHAAALRAETQRQYEQKTYVAGVDSGIQDVMTVLGSSSLATMPDSVVSRAMAMLRKVQALKSSGVK